MKLFATLFLTIAAQTHAEDDLQNLRGVVDIALTQPCKQKGQNCSTSAAISCCSIEEGATEDLICSPNGSGSHNGKCVSASMFGKPHAVRLSSIASRYSKDKTSARA